MAKKTGMMEIAFTNGLVKADAKTGLINLNDMARIGEVITGKEVRLDNWTRLDSTQEFIDYVQSQQAEAISKTLESEGTRKEVFKTIKGRYASTWANIHIAIDFAMWISVEFKYEVIDVFINSKILDFRLLGIDYHKKLNEALDTLKDRVGKDNKGIYINTSRMIKIKVFGEHHDGWDSVDDDADTQKKRSSIVDRLIGAIEMKYVQTWEDVKGFFDKIGDDK